METNKSNKSINLNKDAKAITNAVDNAKPLQIPATSTDNNYYYNNKVTIVTEDSNDIITIIDNSGKYRTSHTIRVVAAKVLAEYINGRYNAAGLEPESKDDNDGNDSNDGNDGNDATKQSLTQRVKELTYELQQIKTINDNTQYLLNRTISQRNDATKLLSQYEEELDSYRSIINNIRKAVNSPKYNLNKIIE